MEDKVVQGLHDEVVGGPDSTNLFAPCLAFAPSMIRRNSLVSADRRLLPDRLQGTRSDRNPTGLAIPSSLDVIWDRSKTEERHPFQALSEYAQAGSKLVRGGDPERVRGRKYHQFFVNMPTSRSRRADAASGVHSGKTSKESEKPGHALGNGDDSLIHTRHVLAWSCQPRRALN